METTAARYYGSTLPESRFLHPERMNTQIVSASPAIIAALSPQETAQSLKTACGQFAMFAERGCKYIGLLRGQLIRSGEAPDEVFAIVKDALIKGGMDEKRAKSTANNGKGHSELAEFALKEGVALKETHFYGIAVGDARRVTSFLRKGGDEAIAAVNKIALTAKGGVTSKAIDKLIPPVAPAPADGEAEGEGGERKLHIASLIEDCEDGLYYGSTGVSDELRRIAKLRHYVFPRAVLIDGRWILRQKKGGAIGVAFDEIGGDLHATGLIHTGFRFHFHRIGFRFQD